MQTEPVELEQRTERLERRVDRVEEILPTLVTKADLRVEIKNLRGGIKETEDRLRGEIKEAEQRMRTHFDVVTEALRHDIQIVAEVVAALAERER